MSDRSVVARLQDVDSTVDSTATTASNPDPSLNGSAEPSISMENSNENVSSSDGTANQPKQNGNANGTTPTRPSPERAESADSGGASRAKSVDDNKVDSRTCRDIIYR
ncbi:hypothetical protein NP493_832g01019 [Ridgeia piscesae]|uniref:Uncharacterized protein n=1 Tax=Ridgeia piscesae TaxID=27915 RepID=A0AAD9NMJ0_RIDPI|nr:hypothetical protein NP493_832g01019 [Ridgeia piscesae]